MKKIKLLAACMGIICALSMSAQTVHNTGYLQITLNKNVLATEGGGTGVCTLDSVFNNVYIHSGAGYKGITTLWDAVVGDWAMDNGKGAMTTINDSTFTICMNLTPTDSNYYSNPNTANVDSGPMPIGDNIFNIGVVFRAATGFPTSGNQAGLDNNLKGAGPDIDSRGQCADIWLIGVNSDSMGFDVQPITVEEEDGIQPIPAVIATWVAGCGTTGVKDISSYLIDYIRVLPNPFTDNVTIQFNMVQDETKVQAQVYDVMGRKVADFSPSLKNGYNSFDWNGAGMDGAKLPAGTYLLKVTNGSNVETAKLIKK